MTGPDWLYLPPATYIVEAQTPAGEPLRIRHRFFAKAPDGIDIVRTPWIDGSPLPPLWAPFDSAPRDGRRIEAWHKVWQCVVTIKCAAGKSFMPKGCDWLEATLAQTWPDEAFSHWRAASTPPPESEP